MRRCARMGFTTLAAVAVLGGCGDVPLDPASAGAYKMHAEQAEAVENGLSINGASINGMSTNGLSTNGLSTNGLSTNGLSTNGFNAWFGSHTSDGLAAMVMKYMVKCAVAPGAFRSYTDSTHASYSWPGVLGFAPGWSSGQPISGIEGELVSACIAAHTNKFGVHVPLSLRGYLADGVSTVPMGPTEATDYPNPEGCFFGNMFDGTGLFAGVNPANPLLTDRTKEGPRACSASHGAVGSCLPITQVGSCDAICVKDSQGVYKTCTWQNRTYHAVTTYLQNASLSTCGNSICEAWETKYNPADGTGCLADCGSM